MRINTLLAISIITMFSLTGCTPPSANQTGDSIVNHWAVLMEKDDYSDVGMTDLLVDYTSLEQMTSSLIQQGWESEQMHIHEGFDSEVLLNELSWLQDQADADDVVFVYLAGHGRYFSEVLQWELIFPPAWSEIDAAQRILIVDSCEAGQFVRSAKDSRADYLGIAAVDIQEFGWCGLEEEGLPIIGFVFTHFFSSAFTETAADVDEDGRVSIQEAARYAELQQRNYMHEVVFAVPEFADSYRNLGIDPDASPEFPHVVIVAANEKPVFLSVPSAAE